MKLLMCDGPLNGQWHDQEVFEGTEYDGAVFETAGAIYTVEQWPNGEWVGMWICDVSD